MDNVISDTDDWFNTIKESEDEIIDTLFNQFGNYKGRENLEEVTIERPIDNDEDYIPLHKSFEQAQQLDSAVYKSGWTYQGRKSKPKVIDYESFSRKGEVYI